MLFGDLTYEELRKCIDDNWIVIIPTGCTEQQGPHLPVDFDTWFVEEISLAVSNHLQNEYEINSLVLPVLPFGPTPEHKGFDSGYVDLPQYLHKLVLASILDSLIAQRFSKFIVWRGCGQHDFTQVVEQYNLNLSESGFVIQPTIPYHRIWCQVGDPSVPGGHADSFATSIALFKRPEAVRIDKISFPNSKPVDWDNPELDFAEYTETGVIGDPTFATAELGAVLWEYSVREISKFLKESIEK